VPTGEYWLGLAPVNADLAGGAAMLLPGEQTGSPLPGTLNQEMWGRHMRRAYRLETG